MMDGSMYSILAYYHIGTIENPGEEVARHKEFFKTRDFRGRIYISEQGINGQASGLTTDASVYQEWLEERFGTISFKVSLSQEHVFEKMTVKYRKQLVALDREVDLSLRGESLSAEQWKEMLERRGEETVVLDVRNDYEWKVGHFEGAELPQMETFREFPAYVQALKERNKSVVMMYCTGGIRCEFYSALLKEEGFEQVYQLDGGVIGYGLQEGAAHWRGKLFVFDDRLVIPVGDSPALPIASCHHCNEPHDVYYNCANMDCNDLFICCVPCLHDFQGCCCSSCQQGRLRPYQENPKPFRKKGKIPR